MILCLTVDIPNFFFIIFLFLNLQSLHAFIELDFYFFSFKQYVLNSLKML